MPLLPEVQGIHATPVNELIGHDGNDGSIHLALADYIVENSFAVEAPLFPNFESGQPLVSAAIVPLVGPPANSFDAHPKGLRNFGCSKDDILRKQLPKLIVSTFVHSPSHDASPGKYTDLHCSQSSCSEY